MKILTLNIRHGGGSRLGAIVDAIRTLDPDITLLTEFRENANAQPLRAALSGHGYRWQSSNPGDTRQNSVLLASRQPFRIAIKPELGVHSHRLIVARFEHFDLVGAYFPQNKEKRVVFDYLNKSLISRLRESAMIIGDFNTGKPYLDEAGKSFHCIEDFEALETSGLVDSWRSRNPEAREYSWFSHAGNGFRIDHVFCTPAMDALIREVRYVHDTRISGVTDHSALLVEIQSCR